MISCADRKWTDVEIWRVQRGSAIWSLSFPPVSEQSTPSDSIWIRYSRTKKNGRVMEGKVVAIPVVCEMWTDAEWGGFFVGIWNTIASCTAIRTVQQTERNQKIERRKIFNERNFDFITSQSNMGINEKYQKFFLGSSKWEGSREKIATDSRVKSQESSCICSRLRPRYIRVLWKKARAMDFEKKYMNKPFKRFCN